MDTYEHPVQRRTAITPCPTAGCRHVFPRVTLKAGYKAFTRCPVCDAFAVLPAEPVPAAQPRDVIRGRSGSGVPT